MSNLTAAEKDYLETLLDMDGGYVLLFTNASFIDFFDQYNIDIYDQIYASRGNSKANRMRTFWSNGADGIVGSVLSGLIEVYKSSRYRTGQEINEDLLAKCRDIVDKLLGQSSAADISTDSDFLKREFEIPNIQDLPVEFAVTEIIQNRLKEAQTCLAAQAYLAVILICGSILEGVLLGLAQREPREFNSAKSSPKRYDKVKRFPDWSLSKFIVVAHEIGILKSDVAKFSHGLRDFRNYIHPYAQMSSGFTPDEHTAKLCFQALKAALADVSGQR